MPTTTPLAQRLRSAFRARSETEFLAALADVELLERLDKRVHRLPQTHCCARGSACVCTTEADRSQCTYRSARPQGTL